MGLCCFQTNPHKRVIYKQQIMNIMQKYIKIILFSLLVGLLIYITLHTDISKIVLGQHKISTWIASLIWSIIGAIGVKLWYLQNGITYSEFSFNYWINKNAIDFIKAIVLCLIVLRFGDVAILVYEYFTEKSFPFKVDDFVIFSMFIAIATQIYFHKSKRKKVE